MNNFRDQGYHLTGKIFNVAKLDGLTDASFMFALFKEILNDLRIDASEARQVAYATTAGMVAVMVTTEGMLSITSFTENHSAFVDFMCFKRQSPVELVKAYKKFSANLDARNNSYTIIFRT